MPQYLFYIFDSCNGVILGTDSITSAEEFAVSTDYFVLDASTGEWIDESLQRSQVTKAEQK